MHKNIGSSPEVRELQSLLPRSPVALQSPARSAKGVPRKVDHLCALLGWVFLASVSGCGAAEVEIQRAKTQKAQNPVEKKPSRYFNRIDLAAIETLKIPNSRKTCEVSPTVLPNQIPTYDRNKVIADLQRSIPESLKITILSKDQINVELGYSVLRILDENDPSKILISEFGHKDYRSSRVSKAYIESHPERGDLLFLFNFYREDILEPGLNYRQTTRAPHSNWINKNANIYRDAAKNFYLAELTPNGTEKRLVRVNVSPMLPRLDVRQKFVSDVGGASVAFVTERHAIFDHTDILVVENHLCGFKDCFVTQDPNDDFFDSEYGSYGLGFNGERGTDQPLSRRWIIEKGFDEVHAMVDDRGFLFVVRPDATVPFGIPLSYETPYSVWPFGSAKLFNIINCTIDPVPAGVN